MPVELPAVAAETEKSAPVFSFFKGGEDVVAGEGTAFNWQRAATKVREHLADALNAQHLSFLFGSGTSSLAPSGTQLGVPTMAPLAEEFLSTIGKADDPLFLTKEDRDALAVLGLDLGGSAFAKNLERLLEALVAFHFAATHSKNAEMTKGATVLKSAIDKTIKFVRTRCTEGAFSNGDESVLKLYQSFFRKLVYRERTRSRPWIFTTNYDLFNETAMDRLGIPYANGFVGSVERRFNPATFRYSLAEQLDITSQKWSAVDSFVYLCKLHGSVNWVEDDSSLYRIREAHRLEVPDAERVMIYPTPTKQNASFGSPYADMLREFQSRVVREQSVLIVVGYSFGDEHINNLIFQALTIPSFRMIVFAAPPEGGLLKQLLDFKDPRIWLIGGEGQNAGEKAHYFSAFVESFMPHLPGEKVDKAIQKIADALATNSVSPPPVEAVK